MFKNCFLVAVRNLREQKSYSLLCVFSLAIGLAVFLVGILYVNFILNFDTFHHNAHRIYGVVQVLPSGNKGGKHTAITPAPLLPAMMDEFPEIVDAARFYRPGRMIVKYKSDKFYEDNILYVDPNFLSFFTFEMNAGNPETVLLEPYSIVLTEAAAIKYFGDKNPIGEFLILDNNVRVRITGIIKEIPSCSSIRYDFLVSMETARASYNWLDDWTVNSQSAFLLLAEGYDPARLEEKFPAFIDKYFPVSPSSPRELYLFPLLDFHLKSGNIASYMYRNPPGELYSSLAGAFMFLLIVCLNFINLSTARYLKRSKEVGVRKVLGARRSQLVKQFLGESLLQALFALPIAVVVFEFICPAFLAFFGNPYEISLWNNPLPILFFLGVTVLVGIFSGSYPAFLLSAFEPVQVLKKHSSFAAKGAVARKILVVCQFALSIILIIGTIGLRKQYDYLLNLDLGYNREDVIVIPVTDAARSGLQPLRDELLRHPDIVSVSAAASLPFKWENESQVVPGGMSKENVWSMNSYAVDYDFVETLDIQIVKGRSFSREYDDQLSCIINETALQQLKWENPIGKQLTVSGRKGLVIGVARDFHFRKLFHNIAPAVLYLDADSINYMYIKIASVALSDVIGYIKEQWEAVLPGPPFEYSLLDHSFEDAYMDISKSATVGEIFTTIAVVLSCLGLLGLASFILSQRTKEIGIRKVLGATIPGIFRMLMKEFCFLVLLANLIAWPAAYYVMKNILRQGYAYGTDLGVTIFMLAALLTFAAAALSVTYQILKTSRTNPVDALKYE